MSELSARVQNIGGAVGRFQNANDTQLRVDRLMDMIEAFTNDVKPTITEHSPTARALEINSARFQAEVGSVLELLEALRTTLTVVTLLNFDPALLTPAGQRVRRFGDNLRAASLEAWIDFKARHLPLGAGALLDAAEVAGLPVNNLLKRSLEQVNAVATPTEQAIARARDVVAQYESLRQQLTQGNPEIEAFLIDLTSQQGVRLQTLNESEILQRWLQDRHLYASLSVVLGRENGR